MFEQQLLATAFNSQDHYSQLNELLEVGTLSTEGQLLLKLCGGYYSTDPGAASIDRNLLIRSLDREVSSPKVRQLLTNVINGLPKDTSSGNVLKEVREHKLHVLGNKLASALSGTNRDGVADLLENYRNLLSGQGASVIPVGEEEYSGTSIAELARTKFDPSELIQIWPTELNERLDGGARRGHHVLIFAPTEMGKTLFAINAVAGFLSQGLRVLYVGNEDPASDIIMRLATRLLERTKHDILADPEAADHELGGFNWHRFTLTAMAPGTFDRINRAVASGGYDVVVLDQLRNIDVKSGNRTEGLERAATEARNLARRHNVLVVSVTQAADSASGKQILSRGDVDSSNVGIPGQCDLMLGIGATAEMEGMGSRCITPVKNKLSGDHSPIFVQVDPTTSKVYV